MLFRRAILLALFKLSGVIILLFTLILVSLIIPSTHPASPSNPFVLKNLAAGQIKIQQLVILLSLMLCWHLFFLHLDLYRSRRLGDNLQEIKAILRAISYGTCLVGLFIFYYYPFSQYLSFLALFWILSVFFSLLTRMLMRLTLMFIRMRGRNLRFALIIGTNQRALNFANDISNYRELGYQLLGFIDDKIFDQTLPEGQLLGDFDHFQEVLNQHVVDEVIIALPAFSYQPKINRIMHQCLEQGIMVRYLLDHFEAFLAKSKIDNFHGSPILTLYNGPTENWHLVIKRASDILFSALGLIILSPLFLIVAILIKLETRGPVFFFQERLGYNKRRFRMIKFRTMVNHAEEKQQELEHLNEMSGPVFKIKNDPRVTRIGKMLRRTSIDELPQLICVLKGDMSLVGPRPLPLRDCNGFNKEWQKRRFSIKPGLTCLWQINGRNTIPFHQWMELDMEYIDNWSLLLDLKILLKTIPIVLKCTGAQ